MPLYFAYGANLDISAMAARCPKAKPVATAKLMNFRFFIMREGYASVRREAGAVVHGLLWSLAPSDVAPLDAFEAVSEGLYSKVVLPVLTSPGSRRAFVYVGCTAEPGLPRTGYLDAVVAAARASDLPAAYIESLQAMGRGGTRGAPFGNHAGGPPQGPVAGVRPRFATPRDRR